MIFYSACEYCNAVEYLDNRLQIKIHQSIKSDRPIQYDQIILTMIFIMCIHISLFKKNRMGVESADHMLIRLVNPYLKPWGNFW